MSTQKLSIALWQKIFMIFMVLPITLCLGISEVIAGRGANELFSDVPYSAELYARQEQAKLDPTITRSRFVQINFDLLAGEDISEGAESILLNLFDDVSFTATKDRIEVRSVNSYTWFGRIEGVEHGQIILTVENGSMAGNITLPAGIYQVRPLGNGIHAIYEIDQTAFPEEAPPIPVEVPPDTSYLAPSKAAKDNGSIIDVMIAYTPAVANASVDIAAEMQLGIDETNQSYANSGVIQRVRLVHTVQVTYTESGSMSTDLSRLRSTSDGYMDNIHTLRDTYAADVVSLWIEGGNYCGIAYFMSTVSTAFESSAFSVVARDCATGYFSFGHELGHNMSAHHDWYVNPGTVPYPYNHGYVYVPGQWRTIMAYNSECSNSGFNCTRLPYWSNPDVLYGGIPMGVPEGTDTSCTIGNLGNPDCDADNRKTLNNTAYTVANFRVSSVATLPQIVYSDAFGGRIYVAVVDLGIIFGNKWEIIVKNDVNFSSPFGFGFRNYNVGWNQAVQSIFSNDTWVGEVYAYEWLGEGTPGYYSLSNGIQGIANLTTTPPPDADVSTSELGLDQRR